MEDKKLKIAFIGWANSQHVRSWVSWFAGRGHEVHLLSHVYEDIPGVKVHSFQNRSAKAVSGNGAAGTNMLSQLWASAKFNYLSYLKYPGYIRQARELLGQIKPDLLQGFYLGFAGYIGAFAGKHPFMVFTGGPDLLAYPRRSLFHRLWTGYALSKIDYLTHTSEEANAAAQKMGFPADRSRFLHIGVDLREFNPRIGAGNIKSELGIAGHPLILSTRGLYDKYYNISGLLKTFALVLKENLSARLVLKYYSAPEKSKFVELAKKLGIYDKIIWKGEVDYRDLPAYYRAADAYVSLSFTDSGPVSMLEAMACGLTPIVSKQKNIGEWVKDGFNGYLVDPDDHRSAAAAILSVLSDKTQRELFGKRNVDIIRQRADRENCFKKIEEISYRLVKKSI
jgi:glycosyltransferase involved in cell wall biosynthesis